MKKKNFKFNEDEANNSNFDFSNSFKSSFQNSIVFNPEELKNVKFNVSSCCENKKEETKISLPCLNVTDSDLLRKKNQIDSSTRGSNTGRKSRNNRSMKKVLYVEILDKTEKSVTAKDEKIKPIFQNIEKLLRRTTRGSKKGRKGPVEPTCNVNMSTLADKSILNQATKSDLNPTSVINISSPVPPTKDIYDTGQYEPLTNVSPLVGRNRVMKRKSNMISIVLSPTNEEVHPIPVLNDKNVTDVSSNMPTVSASKKNSSLRKRILIKENFEGKVKSKRRKRAPVLSQNADTSVLPISSSEYSSNMSNLSMSSRFNDKSNSRIGNKFIKDISNKSTDITNKVESFKEVIETKTNQDKENDGDLSAKKSPRKSAQITIEEDNIQVQETALPKHLGPSIQIDGTQTLEVSVTQPISDERRIRWPYQSDLSNSSTGISLSNYVYTPPSIDTLTHSIITSRNFDSDQFLPSLTPEAKLMEIPNGEPVKIADSKINENSKSAITFNKTFSILATDEQDSCAPTRQSSKKYETRSTYNQPINSIKDADENVEFDHKTPQLKMSFQCSQNYDISDDEKFLNEEFSDNCNGGNLIDAMLPAVSIIPGMMNSAPNSQTCSIPNLNRTPILKFSPRKLESNWKTDLDDSTSSLPQAAISSPRSNVINEERNAHSNQEMSKIHISRSKNFQHLSISKKKSNKSKSSPLTRTPRYNLRDKTKSKSLKSQSNISRSSRSKNKSGRKASEEKEGASKMTNLKKNVVGTMNYHESTRLFNVSKKSIPLDISLSCIEFAKSHVTSEANYIDDISINISTSHHESLTSVVTERTPELVNVPHKSVTKNNTNISQKSSSYYSTPSTEPNLGSVKKSLPAERETSCELENPTTHSSESRTNDPTHRQLAPATSQVQEQIVSPTNYDSLAISSLTKDSDLPAFESKIDNRSSNSALVDNYSSAINPSYLERKSVNKRKLVVNSSQFSLNCATDNDSTNETNLGMFNMDLVTNYSLKNPISSQSVTGKTPMKISSQIQPIEWDSPLHDNESVLEKELVANYSSIETSILQGYESITGQTPMKNTNESLMGKELVANYSSIETSILQGYESVTGQTQMKSFSQLQPNKWDSFLQNKESVIGKELVANYPSLEITVLPEYESVIDRTSRLVSSKLSMSIDKKEVSTHEIPIENKKLVTNNSSRIFPTSPEKEDTINSTNMNIKPYQCNVPLVDIYCSINQDQSLHKSFASHLTRNTPMTRSQIEELGNRNLVEDYSSAYNDQTCSPVISYRNETFGEFGNSEKEELVENVEQKALKPLVQSMIEEQKSQYKIRPTREIEIVRYADAGTQTMKRTKSRQVQCLLSYCIDEESQLQRSKRSTTAKSIQKEMSNLNVEKSFVHNVSRNSRGQYIQNASVKISGPSFDDNETTSYGESTKLQLASCGPNKFPALLSPIKHVSFQQDNISSIKNRELPNKEHRELMGEESDIVESDDESYDDDEFDYGEDDDCQYADGDLNEVEEEDESEEDVRNIEVIPEEEECEEYDIDDSPLSPPEMPSAKSLCVDTCDGLPSPIPHDPSVLRAKQARKANRKFDESELVFFQKPKVEISFVNPHDPIRTSDGIVRQPGKRTRVRRAAGPNERIKYKVVNGFKIIDCRESDPTPETIKMRKQILKKHQKQNAPNAAQEFFTRVDFMDPSKVKIITDGTKVPIVNPRTQQTEIKELVQPRVINKINKIEIPKLTYTNPKKNKSDSIIVISSTRKNIRPVKVFVDQCQVTMAVDQQVRVPKDIPYYIYNPNSQSVVIEEIVSATTNHDT